MNFPIRIERFGSKRETWTEEEKAAAMRYLNLSEDDRKLELQKVKDAQNLEGYGTRSSTAQADSAGINAAFGFPLTTWKPSKLAGTQDIIIYKDIRQIEELVNEQYRQKAA